MRNAILLCLVAAMSALVAVSAVAGGSTPAPSGPRGPGCALPTSTTEEGQTVIYDAYTWQRRELDKRLPLNEAWPSEREIGAQFARFKLDGPPVAGSQPTPSCILRDVYLVNSEPNLTYLIDAGDAGLVIVDPGLEENVERILKNVEALGFSRRAIRWVLNTHAHFDHSMADAHFQRLGAKILVGRADVAAVEKGTAITAKYALSAAQQAAYPTLRVDWPVDDGEELRLGDKIFTAIATPGHTPGSICYRLVVDGRNILFGGDTVLFDYRLGFQGSPFSDDAAYLASLRKLAKVGSFAQWDVLLPGHGTIVLNRADLDLMKAVRQVQLDVDDGAPVHALPFGDDYYRKMMFGRP